MVSPAMPMARVLWVILMVRVLPVMQCVIASLTMSVVRVLQVLSRVMAMWAASMAGVLWVCNKDVQFSPDCSSRFSNIQDACVIVVLLHTYINFHYLRALI